MNLENIGSPINHLVRVKELVKQAILVRAALDKILLSETVIGGKTGMLLNTDTNNTFDPTSHILDTRATFSSILNNVEIGIN